MTQITTVHETPPTTPEPDDEAEGSCDSDVDDVDLTPAHAQAQEKEALQASFKQFLEHDAERTKALAVQSQSKNPFEASQRIIDKSREYQQELYDRAKAENCIAVLDTGSGKTLIACLLIRELLRIEAMDRHAGRQPRIACFLVNSLHLVRQQALVIESNLGNATLPGNRKPLVVMLHGNSKEDLTRKGWQQRIHNQNVVVCTAEILNQCLGRSYVKMEEICLLIFDEAHHAKNPKEHPMARIMVDYYDSTSPSRRPKIFGMTASPVDTKDNPEKAIHALETILDSKVVTTSDMSLLAHSPKANNEEWTYNKPLLPFETSLCSSLSQVCYIEELREYFEFAKNASSELGPWLSDQMWKYALGSDHEINKTIKHFEKSYAYQQLRTIEEKQMALRRIETVAGIVKGYVWEKPTVSTRHLSPKVLLLCRKVLERYAIHPETRCIVFVERRLTAQLLAELFKQIDGVAIRPGVLVGVSKADLAVDRVASAAKHQDATMYNFRAGFINCVFATNVAEEGIDIPQCSLVIRFDLFKSPIQYMQSRGRARVKDSTYAMMLEAGNFTHRRDVDFAVQMGEYIRDVCQALPGDRLLGGKGSAYALLKAKESKKQAFQTGGGAVCNYGNALDILSRYASSLQYKESLTLELSFETEIVEANTDGQFKCRARLGDSKPFKWSPLSSSKALAKKAAAWLACASLRKQKLLDENLNTVHVRERPQNANAHLAVSAAKHKYPMKIKPDTWKQGLGSVPEELYATLLTLAPVATLERPHARLVIFTRQQLPYVPQFRVFLGNDDIPTNVILTSTGRPFMFSTSQLDLLTAYTLDGIFSDVFNKVYEQDSSRMAYWLAPASAHIPVPATHFEDIVDMVGLEKVRKGHIRWIPGTSSAEDWSNKFILDPFNGKYHYFTSDVVQGATTSSPVPESAHAVAGKGKDDVFSFSDSHWRKSKKRLEHTRDPNQPVFNADLVMTRRNFLDVSGDKSPSISCHICPQTLEASSLCPSVAATALVWPSILHRVESYLIVLEAFDKLDLREVPPDLALEAFTKDSNTDDQENQVHTGSLRGMGKNYERLEFIGDSLLKMTTTIMVYLSKLNSDELGLHCARMEMICNLNLFNVATGPLELFQYARTSSFNRLTWYPENLIQTKGRGVKKVPEPVSHGPWTHDLGQKTIADIAEAIIGAALMTSKDRPWDVKFDLAIKAVTKLVGSSSHTILKWSEIAPFYKAPTWSLAINDPIADDMARRVALRTNYTFQHPRLLRSAMTHSSDQHSVVPSYEQLEFVGDAILDMVCINWMFDKYSDRNPQWLTEHKMAMVSNKFLAALAVDLGFDQLIIAQTPSLMEQIARYAPKVRGVLSQGKENTRQDYWVEISSPPKALSDLVESYIGAVLIDSNFNYGKIEEFFGNHVLWYFRHIEMYDSFANRHPTSYVYRKLTEEYKCRAFKVICSDPMPGPSETSIVAGILIHGNVAVQSVGSSSKYAKVRASKECLTVLDGLTITQFREQFGCDCKREVGNAEQVRVEEEEFE